MVASLAARLEHYGITEDTYLIFSTDNGYHVGQHRLQPGKQCSYKEDINIPFLIRGPGVPKGHTSQVVTSHTDLAATFLKIAGAPPRPELDGEAMPLTIDAMVKAETHRQEHVNVEMWGIIMSEGKYEMNLHNNHTYKALRVMGEGYNLRYTVWCSGEHELYDLHVSRHRHQSINRSIHLTYLPTQRPHANNLAERPPRAPKHLPPANAHHSPRPTPDHERPKAHLPTRRSARRAQNVQGARMHAPLGSSAPGQQRALFERCAEPRVRCVLRGADETALDAVRAGVCGGERGSGWCGAVHVA